MEPSAHLVSRQREKARRRALRASLFLALVSACGAVGCSALGDDDTDRGDPLLEVDEHVEQFREEARVRGHDLDGKIDGLRITVHDRLLFDGTMYCGFVALTPSGAYSDRMMFSTEDACWKDLSVYDREVTVFHELGHAVLNRGHDDEKLPNGSWASIMKSRSGFGLALYGERTIERRAYYLDELLDEETPVPAWAQ